MAHDAFLNYKPREGARMRCGAGPLGRGLRFRPGRLKRPPSWIRLVDHQAGRWARRAFVIAVLPLHEGQKGRSTR